MAILPASAETLFDHLWNVYRKTVLNITEVEWIGRSRIILNGSSSWSNQCCERINLNRPFKVRDDTHMMSMKIAQLSRPPTPPQLPCPFTSSILPPHWPYTSNFKWTPTLPPFQKDNQSIKRKQNPRMTTLCYQVLYLGRFSFSVSTH